MFEVVENIYEPMHIFAAPDAVFKPGWIAQFTDFNGLSVCGLSDGSMPIGIVDDIKYSTINFNPYLMVRVWVLHMAFRTDQYDSRFQYKTGMKLYVNKSGLLTTETPENKDQPYVGHIISGPTTNKAFFEAVWE